MSETTDGGVPSNADRRWTFLSNHGHVLIYIARHPDSRSREIADEVGISERAVFSIINDLERGGYVVRLRNGRRNRYVVNAKRPLRHRVEHPHVLGDLLAALAGEAAEPKPIHSPTRRAQHP